MLSKETRREDFDLEHRLGEGGRMRQCFAFFFLHIFCNVPKFLLLIKKYLRKLRTWLEAGIEGDWAQLFSCRKSIKLRNRRSHKFIFKCKRNW